uniref:Uncharacterized protein n=1 Tax=Trichogramma kaykai TaxID=54128 RepID=A0ABD2W7J7_9HYME
MTLQHFKLPEKWKRFFLKIFNINKERLNDFKMHWIAESGPDRLKMSAILPGPLYGLFRKCQSASHTLHYAPPVVRSLLIYMRQSRESPLIPITCEAGLLQT